MWISQLNVRYVFHFHWKFSTVAMKHKFLLPSPYCWVLITTICVLVYVYSFHLNVTGGQFRPFGWSNPVIFSAETISVQDIIKSTIIFQTTAFASACTIFMDFVVQNSRSNYIYILLKHANFKTIFKIFCSCGYRQNIPIRSLVWRTEGRKIPLTIFDGIPVIFFSYNV